MRKAWFFLSFFCAASADADWVFLTQSEGGDKFFVDPDSRKTGEHPRVWVLGDYAKPLVGGVNEDEIRSGKDLQEADCTDGKLRSLGLIAFGGPGGAGQVVRSENLSREWRYVAPGSINHVIFQYLCDQ